MCLCIYEHVYCIWHGKVQRGISILMIFIFIRIHGIFLLLLDSVCLWFYTSSILVVNLLLCMRFMTCSCCQNTIFSFGCFKLMLNICAYFKTFICYKTIRRVVINFLFRSFFIFFIIFFSFFILLLLCSFREPNGKKILLFI